MSRARSQPSWRGWPLSSAPRSRRGLGGNTHDGARLLPGRLAWLGAAAAAASAALLAVSVAARSVSATAWAAAPILLLAAAVLALAFAAFRTRRELAAARLSELSSSVSNGLGPDAVVYASASWQRGARAGVVRWWRGLGDLPEPAHPVRSGRRRGLLAALVLLGLAAMLVNGLLGYHAAGVVVSQYASLVGLSVLPASTPGVVAAWLGIVLASGRPRIGASLAMAGDYARRGLVSGFVGGASMVFVKPLRLLAAGRGCRRGAWRTGRRSGGGRGR